MLQHLNMLKSHLFVRHWCQLHSGIYYTRVYNAMSYFAMLLNLTSLLNFSGIESSVMTHVINSVPIFSAFLIALIRHVQPSEKAQAFFANARFYDELLLEINTFLTMPEHMREEVVAFTQRVTREFLARNKLYLEPPEFVKAQFKKKWGDADGISHLEDVKVVRERATRALEHEARYENNINQIISVLARQENGVDAGERIMKRFDSRTLRRKPSLLMRRSKSEEVGGFRGTEEEPQPPARRKSDSFLLDTAPENLQGVPKGFNKFVVNPAFESM
jgi:hypothetical protein